MSATKIFIDTSEDIAFATDKIRNAESRKVILVVNSGANIITSQVSLKLLAKMILKTDKLVVLVTEDPQAKNFAEKSGIIHVDKISEVTKEVWDAVNNSKQEQLIKINKKKVELISSRQEAQNAPVIDLPAPNTQAEIDQSEEPLALPESTEPEALELVASENKEQEAIALIDDLTNQEINNDSEVQQNNELANITGGSEASDLVTGIADSFSESALENGGLEIFNPELDEAVGTPDIKLSDNNTEHMLNKGNEPISLFTKLEPKIIELDGYSILSGGDVEVEKELADHLQKKLHFQKVVSNKYTPQPENINETDPQEAVATDKPISAGSRFSGITAKAASISHLAASNLKNITNNILSSRGKSNVVPEPVSVESTPVAVEAPKTNIYTKHMSSNFTNRNFTHYRADVPAEKRNYAADRRRALSGVGATAAITSGAGGALNIAKDLISKARKNKFVLIGIAAFLLISFLVYSFAIAPRSEITVVVAAKSIPVSEKVTADANVNTLSLSELKMHLDKRSETETRSDTTDATGKGEDGTAATTTVTVFNSSPSTIALAAGATISQTGKQGFNFKLDKAIVVPIGASVKVTVAAAEIGDKYNQENGTKKDFTYTGRPEGVSLFTYDTIAGGKKEDINIVSQEDFNAARDALVNVLKSSLETKMKALTASTEKILNEEIHYSEPKVTADKKVGDRADQFNMDIELSATIYVVSKDDLKTIAQELVKENSGIDGEIKISELGDPDVSEVAVKDNVATFKLTSNAVVSAALSEETIKSKALGVNPDAAIKSIASLPDVKDVKVKYTPSYIPGFMRTIPSNEKNVTITISKSKS
jgi:hypothetical protein